MHASALCFRSGAGSMDDVMEIIKTELAPGLMAEEGFGAYHALDSGDGELLFVVLYRDGEACKRSSQGITEWVGDRLSPFEFTPSHAYQGEVRLSSVPQHNVPG